MHNALNLEYQEDKIHPFPDYVLNKHTIKYKTLHFGCICTARKHNYSKKK